MAGDRRAHGTGKYTEPLCPPLCPTTVSPGLLQEPPSLPVSTPVLPPPAFLHTAKEFSRNVVLIHVTLLIEAAGVCHLSSPSQGPASRRPPRPAIWVPVPSEPCLLLLFPTRVPSHPGFLLGPELFQQSLPSGAGTGSPSAWDTPSPTATAPAPPFGCLLTGRPARPAMRGSRAALHPPAPPAPPHPPPRRLACGTWAVCCRGACPPPLRRPGAWRRLLPRLLRCLTGARKTRAACATVTNRDSMFIAEEREEEARGHGKLLSLSATISVLRECDLRAQLFRQDGRAPRRPPGGPDTPGPTRHVRRAPPLPPLRN